MRKHAIFVIALLGGIVMTGWAAGASGFVQEPAEEVRADNSAAHDGDAEAAHEGGHEDAFTYVLLELTILILVAVAGRALATRFGQPSVLGELLAGMVLGNVGVFMGQKLARIVMHFSDVSAVFRRVFREGESVREAAEHVVSGSAVREEIVELMAGPGAENLIVMALTLWLFSNLGVLLLLFLVGLESSIEEMRAVGLKATLVAITGVVLPMALGYGAGELLLPELGHASHLFIGATLCATSVGITAAVLKDLGAIRTPEAKIILGAAVLDDVLGLIVLAVVVGIVTSGGVDLLAILKITALAFGFLGIVVLVGGRVVQWTAGVFRALDRQNLKLLPPLAIAFMLAWAAAGVGLATIVGAFAAGLIVSERHLRLGEKNERRAAEVLAPLERLFAPVFFVLMGMQVDLRTFADATTLGLGLALVAAGIIGKVAAGWAAGRGQDALTIGIGMVPRGEVGLIFASIGKGVGVVDDDLFAAIVFMVIVTTVVAPVGLRWSTRRLATASG